MIKHSDNVGELFGALARAQAELVYMQKQGHHPQYTYLAEADLVLEVKKVFAKHGLSCWTQTSGLERWESQSKKGTRYYSKITLTMMLVHYETGQWLQSTHEGLGYDSLDKDPWKAMTGALKYCLRQGFLLGTGDDPEVATQVEMQMLAEQRQGGRARPRPKANPAMAQALEKLTDDLPRDVGEAFSAARELVCAALEVDEDAATSLFKAYRTGTGRVPSSAKVIAEAALYAMREDRSLTPNEFARRLGVA